MLKIPEGGVARRIITPQNDGYEYFFGYYDLQSYSADDTRHLFHRTKLSYLDRLPGKDDVAELGYVNLKTGEVTVFAETTAWNFQQGAMLQWNPAAPNDEVIYNIREGNEFRCVTHNLTTGAKKIADRAVANVSPDGKWGLAINMSRVYAFRPGYGYGDAPDPWADVPTPAEDGVYLVNLETGKSKMIIDYARIAKEFPNAEFDGAKFVVNHITFNTASNRFLFLNRSFPRPGKSGWATWLYTSDLDGNLFQLMEATMVSHYHWKNEKTILGYLAHNGVRGIYEIDDLCHDGKEVGDPIILGDIHTIYSPDRRYYIGDGYPDKESNRHIYIRDNVTGEAAVLHSEYSKAPAIIDNRCDLHNIWSHDAKKISYDSTHRGRRDICELDVAFLYE